MSFAIDRGVVYPAPSQFSISPYHVRGYGGRGCPAAPKSFDTNDLRQIPSANPMPKDFQQNIIKDCSIVLDIDDDYYIMGA